MVAVRKDDPDARQVYWINQKTDLINSIEYYRNQNNTEVLASKTEFLDYNVPIDDKMFSLRDQLPPDVRIADQLTQVSGVAQGALTDEQAAAQTAREFFQALMDKDYKKAGLIESGVLEQSTKAGYGKLNVTALLAIGPAIPQPDWEKRAPLARRTRAVRWKRPAARHSTGVEELSQRVVPVAGRHDAVAGREERVDDGRAGRHSARESKTRRSADGFVFRLESGPRGVRRAPVRKRHTGRIAAENVCFEGTSGGASGSPGRRVIGRTRSDSS